MVRIHTIFFLFCRKMAAVGIWGKKLLFSSRSLLLWETKDLIIEGDCISLVSCQWVNAYDYKYFWTLNYGQPNCAVNQSGKIHQIENIGLKWICCLEKDHKKESQNFFCLRILNYNFLFIEFRISYFYILNNFEII